MLNVLNCPGVLKKTIFLLILFIHNMCVFFITSDDLLSLDFLFIRWCLFASLSELFFGDCCHCCNCCYSIEVVVFVVIPLKTILILLFVVYVKTSSVIVVVVNIFQCNVILRPVWWLLLFLFIFTWVDYKTILVIIVVFVYIYLSRL